MPCKLIWSLSHRAKGQLFDIFLPKDRTSVEAQSLCPQHSWLPFSSGEFEDFSGKFLLVSWAQSSTQVSNRRRKGVDKGRTKIGRGNKQEGGRWATWVNSTTCKYLRPSKVPRPCMACHTVNTSGQQFLGKVWKSWILLLRFGRVLSKPLLKLQQDSKDKYSDKNLYKCMFIAFIVGKDGNDQNTH
jgi:hypothetical protein